MIRPQLPLAMRTLNRAGAAIGRLGLKLPSLNEASLLAAARKKAGLEDFGEETFRVGLGKLIDAWENEARLSTLGRIIAREDVIDLLVNRLCMARVHQEHPEIASAPVHRPIFVIGMPRTGTSILHELLAQDPANRTPLSWEVARPCPPPERETYETDPRIAEVDRRLARVDRIVPDFKKMHPMGARLPQECVAITAYEFASMLFSTTHRIPSYTRWLNHEADLGPAYAFHRRMLQLLQWRCPGERWVLKSPGHLWSLKALLQEYPDALLVQTHRDPLKVVASMTSLSVTLRSMASTHVDAHEIGRGWSEVVSLAMDRSVDAREDGTIDKDRVIDVHFREFLADPFGTIRSIYDRFGMEYTEEAESCMRRFLDENPSDKHGKHTYRFADTGLDMDEEREKVQRYQEFFGVPSEEKL